MGRFSWWVRRVLRVWRTGTATVDDGVTGWVIDLRTYQQSHGLYSRLLWERLFRLAHGERFDSLDSFLCDLDSFRRMLDEGTREWWWRYSRSNSGYTDIVTLIVPSEFYYRVVVVPGRCISITEVTVREDEY